MPEWMPDLSRAREFAYVGPQAAGMAILCGVLLAEPLNPLPWLGAAMLLTLGPAIVFYPREVAGRRPGAESSPGSGSALALVASYVFLVLALVAVLLTMMNLSNRGPRTVTVEGDTITLT